MFENFASNFYLVLYGPKLGQSGCGSGIEIRSDNSILSESDRVEINF